MAKLELLRENSVNSTTKKGTPQIAHSRVVHTVPEPTDDIDRKLRAVSESMAYMMESIESMQKMAADGVHLKGTFEGKFIGDGSEILYVNWNNITGRKRPGAGGAFIIPNLVPSASHAETASFALNGGGGSGSIVSGRESFLTFFDPEPAIAIFGNFPSALSELDSDGRKQVDLTNYTEARISVNVVRSGTVGSSIGFQFSLDGGSSWTFLDGLSGPTASLSSVGSISSPYVSLTSLGRSDLLIRWVGLGGNDVASPAIGNILLGVK